MNRPLTLSDIRPYIREGWNVFRYLSENGDRFVGSLADNGHDPRNPRVTCMCSCGSEIVSSLVIRPLWIVRLKAETENASDNDFGLWKPIIESFRPTKHDLTVGPMEMADPILIQERSPLRLKSSGDVIEITHMTGLAGFVMKIHSAIEEERP